MDHKLQYNVWMREGNTWNAVLKTPVSQVTAEALAMMMAQERFLPYADERFCASVGRPTSGGFENKAVAIGGFIIDKRADEVLRKLIGFDCNIQAIDGEDRWHLLQAAGLINNAGMATRAGEKYAQEYPKQS